MLRSAFRGKPVGSLRPRSSGIKAEEKNDALGASHLTAVTAAVPFEVAAVLLRVKYERCVNESVDGGVFR